MVRASRLDITPLGVYCLAQFFYLATLAPTVLWGDAANFQRLAATLNFQSVGAYAEHRLWIFLAHPITLVNVGDVAFRVNVFTSIWAAVSVAFLYAWLGHWTGNRWAGAVGAITLMVSHNFWMHAVRAEVYSFNLACLAAAMFCCLHRRARGRHYVLGEAALALGATNHAMMWIPALALNLFLLMKLARRELSRPTWMLAGFGFVVPFFALQLLPLQGTASQDLNPFHYVPSARTIVTELTKLGMYWLLQFSGPAVWIGGMGVCRSLGSRPLAACLLLIAVLNVMLILNLPLADKYEFYLLSYFVGAVWVGLGTPAALAWLTRTGRMSSRRAGVWLTGAVFVLPIMTYTLAPHILPGLGITSRRLAIREIPGRPALAYFFSPGSRHYEGAQRYADAVLDQLPKNAVLIVDYTVAQPILYEQTIEKRRPDVTVAAIPVTEQRSFVRNMPAAIPVFLALIGPYYDVEGLRRTHDVVAEGLVYRLVRRDLADQFATASGPAP